jgi:type IV pilus assembly protein PilB
MGAIPRLGDIGVPAHLLAGSLIGCLAQRLARRLCQHCKKSHAATEEECRILGVEAAKPPMIYERGSCEKCGHKGFKGRTAIMEILRIDKGLDELIATHATRRAMMDYALANGFITMQQDGISKVISGDITLAELINTIDLTDRL